MFYNIALRTGIALNFIAIISNMLICFINDESRWNGQMKTISSKCRNIGLIYVALAWFVGNEVYIKKILEAMPQSKKELFFPIVVLPDKKIISYRCYLDGSNLIVAEDPVMCVADFENSF